MDKVSVLGNAVKYLKQLQEKVKILEYDTALVIYVNIRQGSKIVSSFSRVGAVLEDPLTVKVDHLKEKPYDKDDDILKATSFEVISTLRDVLKTSPLWRDHAQTYTQI